MKRTDVLLAVICCLVTACATSDKYKQSLNALIGGPDATLIRRLGEPDETFKSDGHKFLVYLSSRVEQFAPLPNYTGSHQDYTKSLFCTTVFDTQAGMVKSWAIKGNDCAHEGMAGEQR